MIFNLDVNQCVTKGVLKILADNLTPNERDELVKTLCLQDDLLQCSIEWKQLEPKLISMARKDVVDEIQMTTEITNGELSVHSQL